MRVTIRRADLAEALGAVIGVVPARSTIPILGNVLLSAEGEGLRVRGTDLDMEVDAAASLLTCETPGAVTVEGAALHALVRKVPGGAEMALEMQENGRLRVSWGRSFYDMAVLAPEDFPDVSRDIPAGMPIDPGAFKRCLSRTRFAAGDEESRFFLMGVFMHRLGEQLVFVATSGHVLSRQTMPCPAQAGDVPPSILPSPFVALALRLLPDEGGDGAECYLGLTANRVALMLPSGVRIVSKLIQGDFPDYQRVIPQSSARLATLPHGALVEAVERAMVMTDRKAAPGVRLRFAPGRLTLASRHQARGQGEEVVDAVYDGPAEEIGINGGYLLQILGHYGGQTVTLAWTDASGPMIWRDAPEPGDALAVAMPMRI